MDLDSWYRVDLGQTAVHKAWNLERTGLVRHCFTTRIGGVSAPPRDTLNLALHVDDDSDRVLENRRRLAGFVQVGPALITTAEQVHGNVVAVVSESDAGRGSASFDESIPGVDALITNSPTPVLSLFYADCVPVFILDPINRAIAVVHAGWKGTALNIASEALQAMRREFGTQPDNCLAAIGPSIGRCCYDVSYEVAAKIVAAVDDTRVVARPSQDQWRVDLKFANWLILRSAGLPEPNIAISQLCTACRTDDFFSYRRDGETGRMAAIMSLSTDDQ